ncbi:tetratricopeptide repeat protein [Halopelagius fulvigenes]|uniref:Tetratricopeptide repeat protein n=1 Tax=Halopelagius fulvigenes TaxID=1198324 RepID=A0ABD5TUT6_9EURY
MKTASRSHRYSDGQGFDDPYEGFDLGPDGPVVDVDPVDDYALAELVEEASLVAEDVDVAALVDVGLDYLAVEQYEQAIDAFGRAAFYAEEGSREARTAWVNKGVALALLGEYDEAAGAHREALRIGDGTPADGRASSTSPDDDISATAHANLAYALWELGESTRPLEHAERAVTLDPRLAEAWYDRGYFLNESGRHEEALTCLDNALTLGLRDSWVHDERARALDALGEYEAAAEAENRVTGGRIRRGDAARLTE